ncbi:electron transport complex subunit RsxC [Providencia rettgeri]|uniref:electron transport complex subunit RsxC n=1 Tax=Providencia rettgeri TaxID=587 RepID=UPI0018C5E872|nr:electron transport complex subunit RsxC [Providencia rettgeri]MBG5927326.1 electron transport complex subunit RsxC [Providencia rettgeri]
MLKLFNWLKKDNIWDFKGGIHPPEMKLQSSQTPMRIASVPNELIIPLQQHLGPEGELIVQVGDSVLKGQPLTKGLGRTVPVHASTSGVITAIEPMVTAHPSGLKELCVRIAADGHDIWCTLSPEPNYIQLTRAELLQKIEQAGIAGLGGAGFPTASKLAGGQDAIKTLIINAAECEPYITADDRLMQEHAQEVIEGCRVLQHLLTPDQVLIGIEDNKPEAIQALKDAVTSQDKQIFIRVIPTKYPSGGAKQLTKILTGKEVPSGARSSQIGVLMQNVGTVVAIKRAVVDGQPLIERVVTVTGEAISKPGNFWARLGTPVKHLLQQSGFNPGPEQMVIMGGPLMGFTLPDLNVPVVKICNCLLVPTMEEMGPKALEEACIRCGLCVDACPAGLLPQQLYWFSKGDEHEKAQKHNLFDCIECGACAYVCPSNIPLVQYYRQEKAEIREIAQEERRAAEAKLRFEAKQLRMERDKQAREERHKKAAVQVDSADKDAVNAALARVKAKQSATTEPIKIVSGELPDNSAVIAAREARKAQARAKQAEKLANTPVEPTDIEATDDPRKTAVAAAIARAKAKKAAQAQSATEPVAETVTDAEVDPRKVAVAAAIARAKAKKAAQAQPATEPVANTVTDAEVDPRKAAVAAAIARAKAKKAAQAQPATEPVADTVTGAEVDPRKAAVAAAIARAKAKKAAQEQPATEPVADTVTDSEVDPRKAAVAAAIARAKAKKAAQAQSATEPVAETVTDAEVDPRKAAVAAAIARAKAKKAAQAEQLAQEELTPAAEQPIEEETDPRKVAVAAAIARVKAKQAQKQHEQTTTE